MIGRKLSFDRNKTDILVFAAHSDDDILGLGVTLYHHQQNGKNIKIVFVTNGTAEKGHTFNFNLIESLKKSETRYREGARALSLLGISKESILCLGYPDGGTQRYLENISEDVAMLLKQFNPERIYVHCIEGGHIDHDMTSFVVKTTSNKLGYSNVYEWAEYNYPLQPLGTKNVRFLSNSNNDDNEEFKTNITEEERSLKRRALSFHESQNVEQYFLQGEAIRKANLLNLDIELYEHCQLPKTRLIPIVNKYNHFLVNFK